MKLFLFVHGYGSSPKDFSKLPAELKKKGFYCQDFILPGHIDYSDDYLKPDAEQYLAELLEKIESLKESGHEVYLVGFSFGATLCLAAERHVDVSGMVCIGAFLGATPLKTLLIGLLDSFFPNLTLNRKVNVTRAETKKRLTFAKDFPVRGAKRVIGFAQTVGSQAFEPRCPVIFFHSLSDRVSNYKKAALFAASARAKVDFVPFHGLNHFIAHDMSAKDLADVVESFFDLSGGADAVPDADVAALYSQLNEEHRFWALRIFQLVIAFFAVFGLYLSRTLEVILNSEPGAVYYLLSYSTVILIYGLLASMYYFFMVRTQVFLTYVLEPFLPIQGFQQYKLNYSAAGGASTTISSNTSFAIMTLPLLAAAYSAVEVFIQYYDRLIPARENTLVIIWLMVNVALLFYSIKTGFVLVDYGQRKLYSTPTPRRRTTAVSLAISNLYSNLN